MGGSQVLACLILTRDQRVLVCFALSMLLTSGYKTRDHDLEWLMSVLSTEVNQLHLDQRSGCFVYSLYHANEVCCLPLPPFLEWSIKRLMENKEVFQYSLNVPLNAGLCFISYSSHISVPFCLIFLIIMLLPWDMWIQSRLVLNIRYGTILIYLIMCNLAVWFLKMELEKKKKEKFKRYSPVCYLLRSWRWAS